MNAKLKDLYCPNISDLSTHCPEDPDNFCILFRALVGLSDTEAKNRLVFKYVHLNAVYLR